MFGNLFHRKKLKLARLRDAQIALSNNPNNFLSCLEQELRTELAKVSKLEEEFWAMKSRITWLVEGHRNTGFYHTSALVRRSKNHINCMKNNMGNWLTEESDIANYIRTGFASLFMTSNISSLLSLWTLLAGALACKMMKLQNLLPRYLMKKFQAPGSDGLHTGFFQCFWLLVGESVKVEVK